MAPEALAQVLRPLGQLFDPQKHPQLLVGLARADDAAVYRISADLALIATVDFFTPIVDDPYTYGAIAAANALSDVYAMGGDVALALNISCLSGCLPPEVLTEILRGGAEKVAEAGAVLVGGHSVDDKEPKYGLVALGFVHPDRVWTKGGAMPGDVLVLSKPLGVGVITTAHKRDKVQPADLDDAVQSMLLLNRRAMELLRAASPHACTDVTGFALLGHACEMADSGVSTPNGGAAPGVAPVTLRFHADAIPLLPGVRAYAEQGIFPGGTKRNRAGFDARVAFGPLVDEKMQSILFTPETSGGLLAAVSPSAVPELLAAATAAGQSFWPIGEVLPRASGIAVEVV